MNTDNIHTIIRFCLLLLLAVLVLPACEVEDDIPPPSAYVEPEETEDCFLLFVTPDLNAGAALDFECEGPEEFSFFGEKDGTITIAYAENPDASGINTSKQVVEVIQTAGIEPWAGFFFDLAAKVDFTTNQTIKIKVYSDAVGQNINLKLEDSTDGSISKETSVMTTVANEWEELSFIFSAGDSDKFDRFVLFFDFMGPRDATTTHYFDDIILVEGGGGGGGEDPVPTVAAPTPGIDPGSVISLFSDAYDDVPVSTWRTDWSVATLEDSDIQGDAVKIYSELNVAGVDLGDNQIDATTMTHFRTDIWTANATTFRIKLVDFGPNGTFDGAGMGDDVEHEIVIENPTQQEWVSLDIPLTDFVGLTTRANIAQLIYSAAPAGQTTVYVDNVLFYDEAGVLNEPLVPAPTPEVAAENVISLFSDAYTDVPVDTWRTSWSQADFEDVEIAGNATKKYSNLSFVGIETIMNQLDLAEMTHFHLDVWTPDAEALYVKLVDAGANATIDGVGVADDTEDELTFDSPTLGQWIRLDIPLEDFAAMTTRSNVAQLILSGDPRGTVTLFVDNVYFYEEVVPLTEPLMAAPPPPTRAEGDVISLFSDAYTDVSVDTWRTSWSQADFEDVEIAGNATKKYSNLSFVGIETIMNQLDLAEMTHFHLDVWTPDAEALYVKLVDAGANATIDGVGVADDTEDELTFDSPTLGQWIRLDIPLEDFAAMTARNNVAQLIFSGDPRGTVTLFVDNVYFYR
jgi:hypothetical protein